MSNRVDNQFNKNLLYEKIKIEEDTFWRRKEYMKYMGLNDKEHMDMLICAKFLNAKGIYVGKKRKPAVVNKTSEMIEKENKIKEFLNKVDTFIFNKSRDLQKYDDVSKQYIIDYIINNTDPLTRSVNIKHYDLDSAVLMRNPYMELFK